MAARLKSSVLRREERGFGSVSMGRLLVSGMGGGAAFMLASLMQLRLLMIPLALGVFIGGLVLTHLRHGIPLYLYLLVTIRTRLLLASSRQPAGWQSQVTGLLELKPESLALDASEVLAAPEVAVSDGTLDEWEIVTDSSALSGFEVVTDTFYLEGGTVVQHESA